MWFVLINAVKDRYRLIGPFDVKAHAEEWCDRQASSVDTLVICSTAYRRSPFSALWTEDPGEEMIRKSTGVEHASTSS